jgi:uncharacterized OB-fold protein
MGNGTVYTETLVYSAPEMYVNDVPYQLAIIQLDEGGRVTGRILGERASIGENVHFVEYRNEVPYFRR